jgi:hypothetical protein
MTTVVTRTIVENGTTRTDTLRSVYQPWRAVYLIGPGTNVPDAPATTPASEPAAEPAAEPEAEEPATEESVETDTP